MKLLILDTETGGLDPNINPVFAIGAVVWEDGKVLDEFEVFINELDIPFNNKAPAVDWEALVVNKIDLDWLRREGLSPREAHIKFHEFLGKHFYVTGYANRINLCGSS